MNVHVLGICGTFMGGVAALAREAGHQVSGCDAGVYPPMSTQLESLGITLQEGYSVENAGLEADAIVIGNVTSRGNSAVEAVLDAGAPYISGPQWLAENVLRGRHVLAVAGTHGKTSTSSMLAWILEFAGLEPGFLIGGVPQNFGVSARLGKGAPFVVEADEYDTAFFDKRSKFVHYRPKTVILNNLEYDHADIFPDLAAIQWQFHVLMRTVPSNGRVVSNANDGNLDDTLAQGCWSQVQSFAANNSQADWQANLVKADGSEFEVIHLGKSQGVVRWEMMGDHSVNNALAAIAAAEHAGVEVHTAIAALAEFKGIKRRMELVGTKAGRTVYDDFAHHPTAYATTVNGLRAKIGNQRLVAIVEPRSNSMKLGVHREGFAEGLQPADRVFALRPADLSWSLDETLAPLGDKLTICDSVDELVQLIAADCQSGDHLLVMSNGGFGGIHQKLLNAVQG
jgi:UDP-N-acetylmuramate: L-alanyl-gamma-D-glutamyl-meso-diaminopimelate ligase